MKKLGISYIFGGKESLNFTVEGLIDEISLVLVPIVDGAFNSLTLFETSAHLQKTKPVNFFLKSVEKLDDGGLWMKYVINP
ncbi:hypothetical protein [Paenibacillus peoriae]|uniref:hypothetical protein n=1 Tax=Paenibacillus peoriae TaxID=59893 RepID=UPI0011B0E16D|nr:hypothetical protein [Paenibacillus peoriae]